MRRGAWFAVALAACGTGPGTIEQDERAVDAADAALSPAESELVGTWRRGPEGSYERTVLDMTFRADRTASAIETTTVPTCGTTTRTTTLDRTWRVDADGELVTVADPAGSLTTTTMRDPVCSINGAAYTTQYGGGRFVARVVGDVLTYGRTDSPPSEYQRVR